MQRALNKNVNFERLYIRNLFLHLLATWGICGGGKSHLPSLGYVLGIWSTAQIQAFNIKLAYGKLKKKIMDFVDYELFD